MRTIEDQTMFEKIKNNAIFRKHEFKCYLRALINKDFKHQKKFIIFAHWRTGSTLLTQLLNSHPEIKCDTELFNFKRFNITNGSILLPHLFIRGNSLKSKNKTYGFDLKLYQIKKSTIKYKNSPEILIDELNRRGWKIIHLWRKNKLRQAVSNQIAHKRNKWHDTLDNPIKKTKINIDFDTLINEIEYDENIVSEEKEILKNFEHISINYEKDLLNQEKHQNTCNKIFRYLGLEIKPVQAKLRKISSNKLEEEIENYLEIAEKISSTSFSHYLNEKY